ncbi:MAG: hypothetical protein R3B82_04560 [Sandaracinaceae bacterium]
MLDALALTVALELTGDLGRVAREERDALRKVGQLAMLQLGGPDRDEEELEALRMCAAIARDGLRALGGRPLPDEPLIEGDPRVIIPPSGLSRLLRGQLDGFAAGALAMRVRRSPVAMAELSTLTRLASPAGEEKIALAAAEAAAVLDPAGGRLLDTHPTLGVEAYLFEGSELRLALYAEDPDPLRLVAPELTTEDVREGYWIGRVADGVRRVEATLHVGDRSEPWVLAF